MRRSLALLLVLLVYASHVFAGWASFQDSGNPVSGWTTFTAAIGSGSCSAGTYTGTCIVQVSSSTGNDSTCVPVSPPVTQTPTLANVCATLAKGLSLLRDASSDWLLLKKGDVWTNQIFGTFKVSGLTASGFGSTFSGNPILISSYGTGARPLIQSDSTNTSAVIFSTNGGSGGVANKGGNIAVVGLELYSYTRDPGNVSYANPATFNDVGIGLTGLSDWTLIEDCKIRFYTSNLGIIILTGNRNVILNRNVIVDAYNAISPSTSNESQGLYIGTAQSATLNENVFDHNGWNATAPNGGGDPKNHNWYFNSDDVGDYTGVLAGPSTITGNLVANDTSGSQSRPGGTISNNVFAGQQYSTNFGNWGGTITGNFSQGMSASSPGNFIMTKSVGQTSVWSGATVTQNIIANEAGGSSGNVAFDIGFATATPSVSIQNNIVFKFGGGGGSAINDQTGGNTITPNNIDIAGTNNNTSPIGGAPAEPFPNPSFTGFSGDALGAYYAHLGNPGGFPSTYNGFMSAARLQSKDNWNPALTAGAANTWIRSTGFGL